MKKETVIFSIVMVIFALSVIVFDFYPKDNSTSGINIKDDWLYLKQKYYYRQKKWVGLGLIQNNKEEVKIIKVMPNSPAMKAGLRQGDIIRKINGNEIKEIKDLQNSLNPVPVNQGVVIGVIRGNAYMDLYVQVQSTFSKNVKKK